MTVANIYHRNSQIAQIIGDNLFQGLKWSSKNSTLEAISNLGIGILSLLQGFDKENAKLLFSAAVLIFTSAQQIDKNKNAQQMIALFVNAALWGYFYHHCLVEKGVIPSNIAAMHALNIGAIGMSFLARINNM
ncbi:hypothetical protein PHSC3_000548 [Chlamydiales bacterium STE3]|nr:hypothetical protein PHSC3_000548 [Chlamydiales bacterium STE3]